MGKSLPPLSLSKVRVTSAASCPARDSEPLKIRSSMLRPRRCLADCSPMHQRMASTMLDLPQPFGPTMAMTSWSKVTTVRSTNDLNPTISRRLIFIFAPEADPSAPDLNPPKKRWCYRALPNLCAIRMDGPNSRHVGGRDPRARRGGKHLGFHEKDRGSSKRGS